MAKLIYGKRAPFLYFSSENEFYEAYGFLCNYTKHNLEFQWEYNANSGAWGNEGRILFYKVNSFSAYTPIPNALYNRLTAGRGGNPVYRINCNEFIKELVNNYGFTVNLSKPGNAVTRSPQGLLPPINSINYVSQAYLIDYQRGYNM